MVTIVVLFTSLLSSSCSLRLFPGTINTGYRNDISTVSLFPCDTCQYLYNTSIDVMKQHFSGIMVFKAMEADTHRVVMLTEIGLKVFDFEFSGNSDPRVHYIMEPINRKMLIKTITNDIGLLVAKYKDQPECFMDKRSGDSIIRYKNKGRRNDYIYARNSQVPHAIQQSKGIVNKVNVSVYGGSAQGPDSIRLSHANISLHINLSKIQEESLNAK